MLSVMKVKAIAILVMVMSLIFMGMLRLLVAEDLMR